MHRNSISPEKSQDAIRPTASSQQPGRGKTLRLLATLSFLLATGYFLLAPRPAFADPHATFLTDRGQAQVFFNVLAALNQADYVEPPGQPFVQLSEGIGQYTRTGKPPIPRPSPSFEPIRDATGKVIGFKRSLPIEPLENFGVKLPRLRVRQVTPDNGDVYTREALARRALVEAQRVELSNLLCRLLRMYHGEEESRECETQERANNLIGT